MISKTIHIDVMNQFFSSLERIDRARAANQTFNLDTLRTFVAICETGTFRGAAERVHRSPSAISLQIAKLEDQLGAKLLSRDARHVKLSEQGELLLGFARQLLGISDEAMAAFHGSPLSGHLLLAAPHDLGVSLVPNILQRLAESHPGIVVDVRLETSENVRRLHASGDAHLALFNEATQPSINVRELFSEPLVWLMKDGGRAIEQNPLPLATAKIGCAWREAALTALGSENRNYRISYSSDTSMGQVAALRADLAIAALPKSLASHGLIEIPLKHGLPPLPHTHICLADDCSDLARSFAARVALIFSALR